MSLSADLYWSFRSPYCYLGVDRVVEWTRDYDLAVALRPVLPVIVRDPDFLKKVNPLLFGYIRTDAPRVAEMRGLPFAFPRPDPIVVDMDAMRPADDQPHIHRLTYLGIEADRRGRGLAFAQQVAHLIWGGAADDWSAGDRLAEAVARAGLDLAAMDRAIAAADADHAEEAARNQRALADAGHWGVPTIVFQGEPFFGQDRLDVALWRMKKAGLRDRPD